MKSLNCFAYFHFTNSYFLELYFPHLISPITTNTVTISTFLTHVLAVSFRCSDGYADNSLRSYSAFHEDWRKFGQCLSCGKFHASNSCKFRISKCFKCGDIEHIQSVCNTNVDLTATNNKSCSSDSTESSIYNDDLSLSTIAIDSVESQSSSELNQTQNSCETTVSHQSIYQNFHAIVPRMVFPNESHISDEIPCKSEENMLSEHNYDRKPDVVFMAVIKRNSIS
ncbi:unnamed protein product [Schistosoma margrebowiei]|uniref:Uncharacterized protein n=1 Tax=Schistosoma margrebowiei TaxID=48269 RepID=A0A183MLU9_9TREM|nr:unnamed protein product [Schistosoma margrebowiei]